MLLIPRQDLDFILFDLLQAGSLLHYPRYQDHSLDTFSQSIDTATQIAERYFAPHNHLADEKEPWFDGEKVHTIPEVKAAFHHFVDSGLLNARQDYEDGGMQLPATIAAACTAQITAANPSTAGYPFLTMAAANLITHFASAALQQKYLPLMRSGKATGTMALTEPDVGSSLADIKTAATPTAQGHYLIRGHKMFISGGDHDLTDNIVHLVLARVKGAPAGVKGISLFLVPKWLVDDNGQPQQRNDVALAGLLHKMGYRGTTSTVLNFGEKDQCVGYLIGEAHAGLKYMFMMMNEARIGVGLGAAVIGYRGYVESLAYARERPQGRHPGNKDSNSAPIPIIEHADVKRMLLAQKVYAEGALALCLYASTLVDKLENSSDDSERNNARELLDLITPVVKSWPAEFGCKANELAIQVLGGCGYTREYPVEQCYRDNRLNPIHEGTHGIQALDLLGRKLWQNGSAGLKQLGREIITTIARASAVPELQHEAKALQDALQLVTALTGTLGQQLQTKGPDIALANASVFLSLTGHIVVGWIWLWQATVAHEKLQQDPTNAGFYKGKLQACRYFFRWELPQIQHWNQLLQSEDDTCRTMQNDFF
ncbi:MAG: acyl-CoA dehydrogenase [Gammaproteobacteria bacterium]|nr:acyl-CoA dehydrogenase [Gammaproteobacteria bacterium]